MAKRYAQQISSLVPDALSDKLARKTGMTLDLIASWQDIAGPQYADFTLPEKIKWPRSNDGLDGPQPGILILACDGHKAIFIQHALPQLISRLNTFFGYRAISQIKLVQKPLANPSRKKQRPKAELSSTENARLREVLNNIEDEELRSKLYKMGAGVIAKQRKKSNP